MARNENAFLSNFMQGFSFVDEIKRQKKSDQRLEARLKADREERSYQRRRQQMSDQRLDTIFDQQQEDRSTILDEKSNAEAGDAFALSNPNATVEELSQYPHSEQARALIARKNEEKRISGALQGAMTIGQAGQGTQSPVGPSLSEAVTGQANTPARNAPGLPSMTPDERAAHAEVTGSDRSQEFQFGKDKGVSGLQEVDVGEASRFDPEFQAKGVGGKIVDKVAGFGARLSRGAVDIASAITPGGSYLRGPHNAGDEFSGTLLFPADRFTSVAEGEEMSAAGATQEEISAARAENQAVIAEYKKAANRPGSFIPSSRQGALLEGSNQARRAAEHAQTQVIKRATAFLDPTQESPMEEIALQDPRAATVMYLQDRATLESADPDLAFKMDQRMLPILDAAEQDLRAEIQGAGPDSLVSRKQMAALSNLHHARDAIYRGQPSVAAQAEINSRGLKVGDQTRAQSVVDTIFDPDRVVPTQQSPATVRTAATVVGRITPTKRLNETQIEGLATLAQAGWIDKNTALSVMMTGYWPPGQDPSGIAKIQEAGDNVYAITNGGDYLVLQQGKGKVPAAVPNREIGEDQIAWITNGIRGQYPNVDENGINQMMNVIFAEKTGIDGETTGGPGWVRSRFNVTSQEDMRRLGAIMADSMLMYSKKFAQEDSRWFPKKVPTYEQILMSPSVRDKLANEFEMSYTPLPDVKDMDGLDEEPIRQALRDGRAGPTAAANADAYTVDEVKMVYGRNKLMELDAAGRLEMNADGTYTILPEPQGQ